MVGTNEKWIPTMAETTNLDTEIKGSELGHRWCENIIPNSPRRGVDAMRRGCHTAARIVKQGVVKGNWQNVEYLITKKLHSGSPVPHGLQHTT